MASQAYWDWKAAGEPYTLARPCREFFDLIDAAGYTVYHYPNYDHQVADPPEDHTPYSETGFPITSKRWIGHAIDIMPTAGLMSLPNLARRIIEARDARLPGTEWIKYMNWTDEKGACRHERWAKDGVRSTTSSADKGHIHLSAYSDMDTSDTVSRSRWNPLEDPMEKTTTLNLPYQEFEELNGQKTATAEQTWAYSLARIKRNEVRMEELGRSVLALATALSAATAKLDQVLTLLQAAPDPIDLLTVKQGVKEALKEGII